MITAISLFVAGTPTAAVADVSRHGPSHTISAAQESDIRARMTDGGIPLATQDKLIAKLQRGELPLALTDASPVRTFVESMGSLEREVSEYADGSRVWIDRSLPTENPAGIRAAAASPSITGCVLTPGAWYVGCKVSVSDPISSAGFIVDLKRSSVNKAQLRDFRGKFCLNSVGGCTVTGGIVRSTQSSSGPAWARLVYAANIFGVPASVGEIGIRVSGTSVTTYG